MIYPMEGEKFQAILTDNPTYPTRRKKHHKHAKTFKKLNKTRDKKTRTHIGQNRHHLKNKCRGGTMANENLIWLSISRHHQNWHSLFNNSDPEEVILILDRMMSMKGYARFRGVHVTQEEI